MKIYVEEVDRWFDTKEGPIIAIFSNSEKRQIAGMPPSHTRFVSAPKGTSTVHLNGLLQKPAPFSDAIENGDIEVLGEATVEE